MEFLFITKSAHNSARAAQLLLEQETIRARLYELEEVEPVRSRLDRTTIDIAESATGSSSIAPMEAVAIDAKRKALANYVRR